MLKFGDENIGKVYYGSNSIGKIYYGSNLVFQKGAAPSGPYTRVEYIQTDGVAYINTKIVGGSSKTAMIKYLPGSAGTFHVVLGTGIGTEPSSNILMPLMIGSSQTAGFGYNYYYTSGPSIADSITNGTPFTSLSFIQKRVTTDTDQYIYVRQAGEGKYTNMSKTSIASVNSSKEMYLFARNDNSDSPASKAPSGSRLYYCRIYSDQYFTTLLFDGFPVLYRGHYGLWDNVTNKFYGNAADSGAFSGPSVEYQYTPVEYLETDGTAYINTGVYGNDHTYAEIKFMPVSASGSILGTGTGNEDDNSYQPFLISSLSTLTFVHKYAYTTNAPSIANSIANGTPFEAKVEMRQSSQTIYVKEYGQSEYTTYSTTQSSNIETNKPMYLFARSDYSTLEPRNMVESGSRLYYCKIVKNPERNTVIFDGIPCIYNGEYGLWDRVTETFFGNAASSGAFSGPAV